jgi:hypothetical protein
VSDLNPNPSGWVSEDGLYVLDLTEVASMTRAPNDRVLIHFRRSSSPDTREIVNRVSDEDWKSLRTAFLVHRSHR